MLNKITVYIPKEIKERLKHRKVSMSQFCRTSIIRQLNHFDCYRESSRERYNNDPEYRKKIRKKTREWIRNKRLKVGNNYGKS